MENTKKSDEMETVKLLNKLEDLTEIKFEYAQNQVIPKESSEPVAQEIINYILSDKFDFLLFQQNFFEQMASGSRNHIELIRQLSIMVIQQINLSEYAHYVESIKIRSVLFGAIRIPDLVIQLVNVPITPNGISENPHTIIEVLSKSTASKDRNQEKKEYQAIPSLQEYILVSQNEHKIEQCLRNGKTDWILKVYDNEDDTCILTVGVKIKLNNLYQNIKLEEKQLIIRELDQKVYRLI